MKYLKFEAVVQDPAVKNNPCESAFLFFLQHIGFHSHFQLRKHSLRGFRSITAQWKTRRGTHSAAGFCFQTPPPPDSKGKLLKLTETARSRHFITNIVAYEPFPVIHYEPF